VNKLNLEKYLEIVNLEKEKRGLLEYMPLYPMLRVEEDKMYVCVLLTLKEDDVWDINSNVKGRYWVLIDIETEEVVSFNKTEDKDFVLGEVILKDKDSKQKELSKYIVNKTLQYKNYLIDDIKNEELPIQKKLSSILGKTIEIDGENIDLNDYLVSNLEEDIKTKIDELVNILVISKYGSLMFYYDILFEQIINTYKNLNKIEKDKIKICIDIMNYYYDGLGFVYNTFNI